MGRQGTLHCQSGKRPKCNLLSKQSSDVGSRVDSLPATRPETRPMGWKLLMAAKPIAETAETPTQSPNQLPMG